MENHELEEELLDQQIADILEGQGKSAISGYKEMWIEGFVTGSILFTVITALLAKFLF